MQQKIACNSLSSIAVSESGELLVWGSNKYYILGQKRTSSNVTFPATLKISENDIIVSDVSLGEFHAACVINDKYTNSTTFFAFASAIIRYRQIRPTQLCRRTIQRNSRASTGAKLINHWFVGNWYIRIYQRTHFRQKRKQHWAAAHHRRHACSQQK